MDHLTPAERSRQMALMKSKNTAPELAVRRVIYSLGFRYRLHEKGLPGNPDIVFKGRKKVVFVHGCFWHRHAGCRRASNPKSNLEYWNAKFRRNSVRDEANLRALKDAGWEALVIWECELKFLDALRSKLRAFITSDSKPSAREDPSHQST